MSNKFSVEATKTYASEANADKAVATLGLSHIRHFMARDDAGRWFPTTHDLDPKRPANVPPPRPRAPADHRPRG